MKEQTLMVSEVQQLTRTTAALRLTGDCSEIKAPGQFINIKVPGTFLRRPISIWQYDRNSLRILFKIVGEGTDILAHLTGGTELDVLMPLGNGFDVSRCPEKTLLVGGGIGMPPMYALAEALTERGIKPAVILGFNTRNDILPYDDFRALGIEPIIATADGSFGEKGLVTDIMDRLSYDYVCCCGPKAMLRAVYDHSKAGQFSFEERMGCGFGACMGCSIRTKNGIKRICKDGPVLDYSEIIWQQEGENL